MSKEWNFKGNREERKWGAVKKKKAPTAPTSQRCQQEWHLMTASKYRLQLCVTVELNSLATSRWATGMKKIYNVVTAFTQANTNGPLFLQGWGRGPPADRSFGHTNISLRQIRNNLTGWVKLRCEEPEVSEGSSTLSSMLNYVLNWNNPLDN